MPDEEKGISKKVRTQVENFGGILMRRRAEEFGHREKRGERTREIQKRKKKYLKSPRGTADISILTVRSVKQKYLT